MFRSFEIEDPEVTRPILSKKKRSNPMDGNSQQFLTFRSAIVIVAIGLCLVVGGWMLKNNQNGHASSTKIAIKTVSDVSDDSSDSADSSAETSLDVYVYKNMHFLGMGYNLYEGNPWNPTTGPGSNTSDPGFTQPVADLMNPAATMQNEGRTQWNQTYQVPRGVTLEPMMSDCTNTNVFAFEVNGKNSKTSLFTQLSTTTVYLYDDGYVGDLLNGAFTGSALYKTQEHQIDAHNRTYVMAGKGCAIYMATLENYFDPNITTIPFVNEDFKDAVFDLPNTVNPTDGNDPYHRLIREYGTHYTYRVVMGSLCRRASEFSSESIQEMHSSGMNITKTAEIEFSASRQKEQGIPGWETALQQEDVQKFRQLRMDGFYVERGVISDDDSTWAVKSTTNPYPVFIFLDLMSNLLVESQFPGLDNIKMKNTNLRNTILHLCTQSNATCSTTPRLGGEGNGGGEEEGAGEDDGTGMWIVNG